MSETNFKIKELKYSDCKVVNRWGLTYYYPNWEGYSNYRIKVFLKVVVDYSEGRAEAKLVPQYKLQSRSKCFWFSIWNLVCVRDSIQAIGESMWLNHCEKTMNTVKNNSRKIIKHPKWKDKSAIEHFKDCPQYTLYMLGDGVFALNMNDVYDFAESYAKLKTRKFEQPPTE